EMQHQVDAPGDLERAGDVARGEAKPGRGRQMRDVGLDPGQETVDRRDLVAFAQEPLAEVRADESGPAGDHDARARGAGVPAVPPDTEAEPHPVTCPRRQAPP